MSDVVAELATRVRLSDPKPARCAGCFTSSDVNLRFVDFDGVAIDRGAFVDPTSMAVLDSIDELHLCEACVRSAAETLGFRPEIHRRQLREIQKQELTIDYWRDAAKRKDREIETLNRRLAQLEASQGLAKPRRGR